MLSDRTSAPMTLSSLAAEAQVSRRTLYVHWGTIQQVISESVTFIQPDHIIDPTLLTPRELLRQLLVELRTSVQDPASNVALATMIGSAAQDDAAAEVVRATGLVGYNEFVGLIGPTTIEQYAQLVGPILYTQFICREPASDDLVDVLVERGLEMLTPHALSTVA